MRWEVKISGPLVILEQLAEATQNRTVHLRLLSDDYLLESPRLAQLDSVEDVRSYADRIVRCLRGLVIFAGGEPGDLRLERIGQLDRGKPKYHIYHTLDVLYLPIPDKGHRRPPSAELGALVGLTDKDQDVSHVLELLAMGTDWVNLYRVYEVVEAEVSGQGITGKGWASDSEVRRFKHTANHPGVTGFEARHGRMSADPPVEPMAHRDAIRLVKGIVGGWLAEKLGQ